MTLSDGILDPRVDTEAIVQQTNCIGTWGLGLAAGIATRFPYGCPYFARWQAARGKYARPTDRPWPGTIEARAPPGRQEGPIVINIHAHWAPGTGRRPCRIPPPPGFSDSRQDRLEWFATGLGGIAALQPPPASVAFPKYIGCGRGGGSWAHYGSLIEQWAHEHPDIEVKIVEWGNDPATRTPSQEQA